RHQRLGHLQDARLAGGWFLRERSKAWRAFPNVHRVRVRNPKCVCVACVLGWISDKTPDERVNLVKQGSAIYWRIRLGMALHRLGVSTVSPSLPLPPSSHPVNFFV